MLVIEILILLLIVAGQLFFLKEYIANIRKYTCLLDFEKGKFQIKENKIEVDENADKESKIIIEDLNRYLHKNKGAIANFELLKDTVERRVDALETKIQEIVPKPLFLGLAGTMIGIIIGLFSIMNIGSGTDKQEFVIMSDNLLTSIGYAMVVSLIGIVMTIIFSYIYNINCKPKSKNRQNDFLSFLQVELLPIISKGEKRGIDGLSAQLDNFGHQSKGLIKKQYDIASKHTETFQLINELNIEDFAKSNTHAFNTLKVVGPKLVKFASYYETINQSLEKLIQLNGNVEKIVNTTSAVESVSSYIETNVKTLDTLYKFISVNFTDLDGQKKAFRKTLDQHGKDLNDIVQSIKTNLENETLNTQHYISSLEADLKNSLEKIKNSLVTAQTAAVAEMRRAFDDNVPQFKYLSHLQKLEQLDEILNQVKEIHKLESKFVDSINIIQENVISINTSIVDKFDKIIYEIKHIKVTAVEPLWKMIIQIITYTSIIAYISYFFYDKFL